MSNTKILTDQSNISRADQLLFKLESILALISGFCILSIVLLSSFNALGRWLFSIPIDGYIDWIEQSMAFIALLGIAYVQREGEHIRMDMFISKFKKRVLWLVESLTVSLMFLITLVLIYGSYLHFLRAYQFGDSTLDIDLPTWPSKLVVPLALGILAIRLSIQLIAYIKAFKKNTEKAVAIPIIENAKEIAIKEAQIVNDD